LAESEAPISAFGIVAVAVLFHVLGRSFGNCQPDPVARLLRYRCAASSGVGWRLVTYWNA
jgi:hypothetical protein